MSGGIFFIENREKTRFWAAIASKLLAQGIPVDWLVQNPLFKPKSGNVHLLPFPESWHLAASREHPPSPLLRADRGSRFFEAGERHYDFYAAEIERVLLAVRPALVLGEVTLFHELLTIEACERLEIPYVHPAASRYPAGRFTLLRADSQRPLVWSGHALEPDVLVDMARDIRAGRHVPQYMRKRPASTKLAHQGKWAATRGRVWASRLRGERYNTPSLARKLALARSSGAARNWWCERASTPAADERSILYPLQLQPEANIDVWGRPFSDQAKTIREMLAAAPRDVTVSVKANPKFKYEVGLDLMELGEIEPRLHFLPLEMPMQAAQACCLGTVTISGTVGYEAIFGRGRCISLRHPVLDDHFPMHVANSPNEAVRRLLNEAKAGYGSVEEGVRLLEILVAESFPGTISDPLSNPNCMERDNIDRVASAIEILLESGGDRLEEIESAAA